MCDMKTYNSILGKLWRAATAGDARKLQTTQRVRIWRAFYALCFSHDFIVECELIGHSENATCTLICLKILFSSKPNVVPTIVTGSLSEEIAMTVVEEDILRDAAVFVFFSEKNSV